jgi:hypothetical protein
MEEESSKQKDIISISTSPAGGDYKWWTGT